MTVKLAIFNHKGGVGKTTLTLNVAAALADTGKRVLVVDSDPQCNLTSYIVADEVVDDLLDNSDGEDGRTLWSAIKPISEASGGPKQIEPIETSIRNVYLLPGDIRMSEFENDLNEFWGQCIQGKRRGFNGTTALSQLVSSTAEKYDIDLVFYDSGPNIGPLNRAILLDCDYFIVPVACDLFSLRALKTLGRTLISWIKEWSTISAVAPEDVYLLAGSPRFLGYVPEGFRVYGGRVAGEHSSYLVRIEKEVQSEVVNVLRMHDPNLARGRLRDFKLGEVKNLGTIVATSQKEGKPIFDTGAQSSQQRQAAARIFARIAARVAARLNGEHS